MFIVIMYIQCIAVLFFFPPFIYTCYCMFIQYLVVEVMWIES
ncbi:Uncharacterised protein [Kluyvera cryocrescens]|nr:Uncharacterised protein [Kluyvera cryocrescens]